MLPQIINQLSGSTLAVSDNPGSLEPVTTAVQEASCEIDGRPVLMIDTPSLDAKEGLRSVVEIIADNRPLTARTAAWRYHIHVFCEREPRKASQCL